MSSSKENLATSWSADAGRRRSMRVLLSVPILVSGKLQGKEEFNEHACTLVVNAHGALIALNASVMADQLVTVSNKATQQSLDCRIVYVGRAQDGKTQMGIEFLKPCPTFWQIDFPPEDWVAPEN
jgi:hypothetical protein